MPQVPGETIVAHFSVIEEVPTVDRTKLHRLIDIAIVAVCAAICVADKTGDKPLKG